MNIKIVYTVYVNDDSDIMGPRGHIGKWSVPAAKN